MNTFFAFIVPVMATLATPASALLTVERTSLQTAPGTYTMALRVCDTSTHICATTAVDDDIAGNERAALDWASADRAILQPGGGAHDLNGNGAIEPGEVGGGPGL
jgi:hypothetical protein